MNDERIGNDDRNDPLEPSSSNQDRSTEGSPPPEEHRPEIVFFPRPPGYVDPHDGPGYLRSKVFELEGAEALDVALRVPSPADEQSVIESEVLVSTDKEEWLVLTHTTTAQAATLMEQLRVGGWRFVRAVLRWSGDGARMPLMVGFLDPRT